MDVGKVICSFDETLLSAGVTVLFEKGNPLLDRFSILFGRRFAGRHWTELQIRASLRSGGIFRETAGDLFFAFTVSHLMLKFVVFLLGAILSSALFIAELILNCLRKRRKKTNSHIRRVRILC